MQKIKLLVLSVVLSVFIGFNQAQATVLHDTTQFINYEDLRLSQQGVFASFSLQKDYNIEQFSMIGELWDGFIQISIYEKVAGANSYESSIGNLLYSSYYDSFLFQRGRHYYNNTYLHTLDFTQSCIADPGQLSAGDYYIALAEMGMNTWQLTFPQRPVGQYENFVRNSNSYRSLYMEVPAFSLSGTEVPTPAPEPTTMLLGLLGMGAAAARRQKK